MAARSTSRSAETVSERLKLLMAIDRVDLPTVKAILPAPRMYPASARARRCLGWPHAAHQGIIEGVPPKHLSRTRMERIVNLHIEKLPEGVYLATSDDIPGLVAQGRTVAETLEIARDVGTKLLEAQSDLQERPTLPEAGTSFDYPLVVGGY